MKIRPESVPESLRALITLAEDWGSLELDGQQFDRARSLPTEELPRLLRQVGPHLDSIDAWFDSFASAKAPEEAWAFFYLARAHDVVTAVITPTPDPSEVAKAKSDLSEGRKDLDEAIQRLNRIKGDVI